MDKYNLGKNPASLAKRHVGSHTILISVKSNGNS